MPRNPKPHRTLLPSLVPTGLKPVRSRDGFIVRVDGVDRPVGQDSQGRWKYMTTTWSVKISDGDKRREVSTGETDYDLAVAWIHRRMSGQPEPVAITPPKPIQDVLKAYLDDLASRAGASHVRDVAKRLDTLRKDLKWETVNDLAQVRSAVNLWSRQEISKGLRSVRTVNCYTSAVKAFVAFISETTDLYIRSTGIAIHSESAAPRRPRRALTPEQYQHFIETVRLQSPYGQSRSVVYEIATRTGLRRNEIRQLDASQLNLGPNPSIQLKAGATKNKKADLLPIDDSLAQTLRSHLRGRDRGPVCSTMPTMRTFNLDLRRAGIPKTDLSGQNVDFHSLRKSFVTWLLVGGADARVVQALARHSSLTLTTSTYTDTSQLPTRKALDALPTMDRMWTNSGQTSQFQEVVKQKDLSENHHKVLTSKRLRIGDDRDRTDNPLLHHHCIYWATKQPTYTSINH